MAQKILTYILLIVALVGITYGTVYMVSQFNVAQSQGPEIEPETSVTIYLEGEKEVTVEVGTDYYDAGAKAIAYNPKTGAKQIDVTTTGNVDVDKIGRYRVTYSAIFQGTQYTAERTVKVVDTTPPVITVNYHANNNIDWITGPETYEVKATDNYDGDITNRIRTSEENGMLLFTVNDSSGNAAQATCKKPRPVGIQEILFPDETDVIYSYVGETPVVPKAVVYDTLGNDLSSYLRTSGTYDPNKAGRYEVRYYIQNNAGEIADAYRTFIINQRMNPNLIVNPNKVIYLTWNGGPGYNTQKVLDILTKYNVRATFFVSCNDRNYYSVINSMRNSGHTIGLYTNSQDYADLYQSADKYEQDIWNLQKIIENQIGAKTFVMRFPGGSDYGKGASSFTMARLRGDYKAAGYRWYDWTIDSNDLNSTANQVYMNVVSNVRNAATNIVVFNDSSVATLSALENIIKWGLDNGYTFMPLT